MRLVPERRSMPVELTDWGLIDDMGMMVRPERVRQGGDYWILAYRAKSQDFDGGIFCTGSLVSLERARVTGEWIAEEASGVRYLLVRPSRAYYVFLELTKGRV